MPHGTEADGTENMAYCKWCYDGGQLAYQSEDELIEKTAPFLMEATGMSQEEPSGSWASFSLTCSTGRSSARGRASSPSRHQPLSHGMLSCPQFRK